MSPTPRHAARGVIALLVPAVALVSLLAGCSGDEDGGGPPAPGADPELRRWRVPAEAPTIQAGLDSAAAGDTVLIAPGTYAGEGNRDIDFAGKAVTVRGDGGPDSVTIDCQGTALEPHRAFLFTTGEGTASVVRGVRIVNGYAGSPPRLPAGTAGGGSANGGAVFCLGSSPTLLACEFADCIADNGGAVYCGAASEPAIAGCVFSADSAYCGAAVYCDGAAPALDDCDFTGNRGYFDGAIYLEGGSSPALLDCSFSGNVGYYAGCLYVDDSSPQVGDCFFQADSAYYAGVVYASGGSPAFSGCDFVQNAGSYAGAAFFSPEDSVAVAFDGCAFDANRGGDAGALYFWYDARATIHDCVFTGNQSGDDGGAINFWNESRGTITSCLFEANAAADDGGAINFWNDSVVSTVSQSRFLDNAAGANGGAVNIWNDRVVDFDFCLFARNSAPSGTGSAINLWNTADVSLANCTLYGNVEGLAAVWCHNADVVLDVTHTVIAGSTAAGEAIACGTSAFISLDCCDIFGNEGGDYSDCISGFAGLDGNFSSDPLFCDAPAGNFDLQAGSPCVAHSGCGQVGAFGAGCAAP